MVQEKHHIVDILFVLGLFAVFTVSALVLVTIGADVYQHTVQDMSSNYEGRTATSYLTEKLRQNDVMVDGDGIQLADLSGTPALLLTQEIEGDAYSTYLYLHEGHLKELFMRQGSHLGDSMLAAGQNIMELEDFQVEQVQENLFAVYLTNTDGSVRKIYLSTHCD